MPVRQRDGRVKPGNDGGATLTPMQQPTPHPFRFFNSLDTHASNAPPRLVPPDPV
jgi:hypothetical protein